MPFRGYAEVFSPEVLDAMTAAFNAAVQAAEIPLSETGKQEIAERILQCASSGVEDPAELTTAALRTLKPHQSILRGLTGTTPSDTPDATLS